MFTRFVTHGLKIRSCTKLAKAYSKSIQHEVKEIEIPVPWGKVAGKLWGSQDKQPILAMHGWQDNAASFDNIAPLIVKNTPVLAIDLPGHGLSSWLPPGFMYSELVYLLLVKRIRKYFGWERLKVMAHSLSAMTAYWYAAMFPKEMEYVIALDFFKFPTVNTSGHAFMFANAIDAFFKVEESNNNVQSSYSESEIIQRATAFVYLDESAFRTLMTRGTTRKEDGTYVINRDPRVRVIPVHSMFSQEQLEEYAKLVTCRYLIIRGDNEEEFYGEEKELYYSALNVLKAANDKVQFEAIPASHHLHLTHAKDTAAIINPFLEKYD
ncbi:PREDICTED: probable serine hydrolase [Wasmannia auropunctata]|uniref:probable serine hydrolase n=1 Tax=Wasmannia auropunctata TaxID=64793 RepID=UPI0005ED6530|nr:PREDICTED: probable serine hydrolase [Wasmannia auropunctata]XP_011691499.1 PREDICTED: probable serine hydrolase [Wasmannia auropunctata]XP_011691507.1 PREDICTED: probable serine hydrolase [Wasmannia auropunctata]